MRASLLCLVATLGACGRFGFDAVPGGGGGGDSDACTSAQCLPMPDAQDLFDAPRGDPGVDTDGDGVFDDVDNCIMVANVDQHDEDNDGYGDVCDNCPTVANTSQADVLEVNAGAAADGVGDACDPRPTGSGDSIRYFETFEGSTLSSDWTIVFGTWTVGGDAVVQPSLVSDQRMHNFATGVGPNYIVETKLTFSGFDVGNVNGGLMYRISNNNGWLCSVFRDAAVSMLAIWTVQNGAANFERSRAMIPQPSVGSSYRLMGGAYGSNQYCALDSFQTGPSAPFTGNQNADGIPALRMNRTSGSYSYFIVYALGGPL
jgi:hypothetical protein